MDRDRDALLRSAIDPFRESGFCHLKGFFRKEHIDGIRGAVLEAHRAWERENGEALQKGAVNSAFLTSARYCRPESGRRRFFEFIAMDPMIDLAYAIMARQPFFMNTQLFFNPIAKDRRPYWHRDIQYSGLPEDRQRESILEAHVLHFRIPLEEDPGLEFIPGSHKRWDTVEEREVRLGLNGRKNHEVLPGSVRVPHLPTDLLVFSAHLIHRGVYAGERCSLDVLFADFRQGADAAKATGHFPDKETIEAMKHGKVFELNPD